MLGRIDIHEYLILNYFGDLVFRRIVQFALHEFV